MTDFTTYNFHTHTYRCLHAVGTEREYIESAIKNGIKVLGFADHVPCPFKEEGRKSTIRMEMQQADGYVQILKNLKEEYKNDIEIYIGFEAEYIPEFHEIQVEMCRRLDCDYMIMGQHFLSGEIGTAYMGNVTSSEKILEAYVNSVLEGAETGRFMYIAHPDLIHYEGDEKIYEKHMRRLCEKLNQMDVPLEINNLGMAGNRHYPTERFWKIAGEIGNTAVIGLDAHSVHDMENIDAYKRCIEIVKKCSINLLTESKDVIKYMWESRKILHNKPTK